MKDSKYIKLFNRAAQYYYTNEVIDTNKGLYVSIRTKGYKGFKLACDLLIKAEQNSIAFTKGVYKYQQLNELFRLSHVK